MLMDIFPLETSTRIDSGALRQEIAVGVIMKAIHPNKTREVFEGIL